MRSFLKSSFNLFGSLYATAATHQCPKCPMPMGWRWDSVAPGFRIPLVGRFSNFSMRRIDAEVKRTGFFESLKSPRRLRLSQEVLGALRQRLKTQLPDPLAGFPPSSAFDVLAGDGHFRAAAAPDRHADGKKLGHLFTLDLRTPALGHLTVGDQVNRKKEHATRALKRLTAETLSQI